MKKYQITQQLIKCVNNRNIRNIVFKLTFGFVVIAVLCIITIRNTKQKFSQLSHKVSSILEPNVKLLKLKEIAVFLNSSEASVIAFTVTNDTAYLMNYKNIIRELDKSIDTLLSMSLNVAKIDNKAAVHNNFFSAQIDTLNQLISVRIDLFNEYIELKSGKNSEKVLLQLIENVRTDNKKNETDKSFISQLFSFGKDEKRTSDSEQNNILKIISGAYQNEKKNESTKSFNEIVLAQREHIVLSHISSILNNMEQKELFEVKERVLEATIETAKHLEVINKIIMTFGILFAIMLLYFIYQDIGRVRRFKEQLQFAKISAEKQASFYSLSLIEASLDPLITINTEGKITDVNEATVNITGVSRNILNGSDFFNYFIESQKAREVYLEVFSEGNVADSKLTIIHKDGKQTSVIFNGSVYKNEKGIVLGVVMVARDISKQILFEKELIEAKDIAEKETKKAEESTRLIEAFLANMSHEIRTPMNAIMGFADMLSKKNLEEKEKKYVSIIKSAGDKLLLIINDILDISKIEAGMMSFESVPFSVKETSKSLNVMFLERARQKNIELLFGCDDDVPGILLGDHTRLTQIIINLVDNALKFTKTGSVKFQAKVESRNNKNITILFTVTDTGIGIPNDKIDKIFQRFRQAEHHTTRMYGGTGLGLSIAKQLVELQGGAMSVSSVLYKGSVFSFSIPYKYTTQTLEISENVDTHYNMEYLAKLKILLVEDSQLNIQLVLSLFSENNLNIEVVENGRLCVDLLKKNDGTSNAGNFDLVLMDMEMPIMNGYEATKIIRDDLKSDIPIIAMTAHAMAGEREKCLSLGMDDYISKPLNSVMLFEKMYELTKNLYRNEQE